MEALILRQSSSSSPPGNLPHSSMTSSFSFPGPPSFLKLASFAVSSGSRSLLRSIPFTTLTSVFVFRLSRDLDPSALPWPAMETCFLEVQEEDEDEAVGAEEEEEDGVAEVSFPSMPTSLNVSRLLQQASSFMTST